MGNVMNIKSAVMTTRPIGLRTRLSSTAAELIFMMYSKTCLRFIIITITEMCYCRLQTKASKESGVSEQRRIMSLLDRGNSSCLTSIDHDYGKCHTM